jgi:hypothetical protein
MLHLPVNSHVLAATPAARVMHGYAELSELRESLPKAGPVFTLES